MQANADVTDALRRTIALMQAELERSVLSSQLLDTSTSALKAGSLQHDSLTGVMSTSKQLIIALEKSDWLDRMLILSAFSFFILVVLFIVKQRIVDKSLRIAFWWTKFIPSFSDDEDLLREAEKGMASAVTEVSTVAATIVSSVAAAVSTVLASSSPSSLASSILPTETLLPNATEAESTEATSPLSESISLEVEGSSIPADPAPSEPLIHVEL